MNTELFHFLRPMWLLAIIPWLLASIWLFRQFGRQSNWRHVVSPELLPYLLQDNRQTRKAWALILMVLGGILSIIALAGPTWEKISQPVFRQDHALVIVLDLSRSMDAQDIKPSRLQRAHFKITDILKSRREGQTALVVYAADAFTVSPLTDDDETILAQLPALTTDLVPAQGSRVDRALALAEQLLKQASQTHGQVLLITDEVDRQAGIASASNLAQSGYRLSILGVGTAEGAPIPVSGGMLKDGNGNIVIARLLDNVLRETALAGGGHYVSMTSDESDLNELAINDYARLNHESTQEQDQLADNWKEVGPWLLLPVLPLAALAFRRGLLVIALILLLPLPPPANAADFKNQLDNFWQGLWKTPDQQAQELFNQKQPQQAAEQFQSPGWRGSANYQSGNYEQALQDFQTLNGADARYNEGNALARMGRYEDAIKAYDKALELQPENEDAIHNRQLIEEFLKQQQSQPSADQQQQNEQDQPQPSEDDAEQQQAENQQPQESESTSESGDRDMGNSNQQEGGQSPESSEETATEDQQAAQQSQKIADNQSQQQQSQPESGQPQPPEDEEADAGNAMDEPFNETSEEQQLAREQWLNRIPDDPSGLLKRKFKYQYQQRARTDSGGKPW